MATKKKGNISVEKGATMIIVLIALVLIFVAILPKLGNAKDTLFDLLGIRKKCKESGKPSTEYSSELSSFFENPNKFRADITKNDDIIKLCKEFEYCFQEDYQLFKERCSSLKSNKCRIDSICRITSDTQCYCHTQGSLGTGKPEICSKGEFCYEGDIGCDSKADAALCKKTNPQFELPPLCRVDNICQIRESPCSCHTEGSKKFSKSPEICKEEQFCYKEDIGCDSKADAALCKKTNPQFELPPLCEVDNRCQVKKGLCSCSTAASKNYPTRLFPGICSTGEFCYEGNIGCDDKEDKTKIGRCSS